MGTRNRQRRAEKKRRRHRDLRTPLPRATVEDAAGEVMAAVDAAIEQAWDNGWQPADIPRALRRGLSARHTRLLVDAIAVNAAHYPADKVAPEWADQLRALRARVWWAPGDAYLDRFGARYGLDRRSAVVVAVEVLSGLRSLPTIPVLLARPGRYTGGDGAGRRAAASAIDPALLSRVRALLAKAESTGFTPEAEAFNAKAQELMARYAIDHAMLDDSDSGAPGAGPSGRRVGIDDPYAGAKSLLLDVVATANRCRAVWSSDFGFSTVFGYPADLEVTELLFTSLLVQASTTLRVLGALGDRRSRSRRFRQSFLVAYASRIGQRLRDATEATVAAAGDTYGDHLLPVLASRQAAVDDEVQRTFPKLQSKACSATDYAGWEAGTQAADRADLATRAFLPHH